MESPTPKIMNGHTSKLSPGDRLREELRTRDTPLPLIGVFDTFSATVAAQHYNALFLSGFGFSASYYGLPDIGFIAWSDMVDWVRRIRTILPDHHLIVDIDDGYCDVEVACHVVSLLEQAGASAVVMEDQKRPRRCGHFEGKQLLDCGEFVEKLKKVLETRKNMFVIARTDSADIADIEYRVTEFKKAGPDAILVDALRDLKIVKELSQKVPSIYMFNQIAGGKSPPCTLTDLKNAGIMLVNYSTPCLFAAQTAMNDAMIKLKETDGFLPKGGIGVKDCTELLNANLARRDSWKNK
jgi:2-methylisocitrate lyase-like PEP mutase family enzyme